MHQGFGDLFPRENEKTPELKNSEIAENLQAMKPSYVDFILEEEARPEAYKKIKVLLEKLKNDDHYFFDEIRDSYYYLTDYFEWLSKVMGNRDRLKNDFIENAKFFTDSCLNDPNNQETANQRLASQAYFISEGKNILNALMLEVADYQESPADEDIIPTIDEMLDGENKDNRFWKNFLLFTAYKNQDDSAFPDNRLKTDVKR